MQVFRDVFNRPERISFKEKMIVFPLMVAISVLFILVYSVTTSPLFVGTYSDSAFFLVLGRFFLMGEVPYVDFFDHKGPILIFMEALGQLLHSDERTGVFILQTILFSVVLFIIYRLSRLYLNKAKSFIVIFVSLCFFSIVTGDGNSTEELSLIFILPPFFFITRYVLERNYQLRVWHLLLIGICCGMIFWMRINNMAIVCAGILFVVGKNISTRNWKELAKLILYVFLGFVVVSLPIVIYFYKVDALSEMMYATFTFNFMYTKNIANISEDHSELALGLKLRYIFIRLIPLFVFLFGVISFWFRNRQRKDIIVYSALLLFFSVIATQIGTKSACYLILTLPAITFAAILYLTTIDSKKKENVMLVTAILILLCLSFFKLYQKRNYNAIERAYIKDIEEVMKTIPEDERKSVIAYQTNVAFFFYSKLPPYYRYFTSQDRHGGIDGQILKEMDSLMENNPAKWMVIEYKELEANNPRFPEIRDQMYDVFFENESFLLYRVKDKVLGEK